MNWSSSIKELRKKMQLSQDELAKELGISFASVNRYENGKFEPTIKVKRKIKVLLDKYGINNKYSGDVFANCLERLKDNPLMIRALTDKSYSEVQKLNKEKITPDNFTLATYGDAVLKLAYCEVLFDTENMTEEKKKYENDEVLVVVIGNYYKILNKLKLNIYDKNMPTDYGWNPNKNKEDNVHKHIATCVEAIIGAIYKIDQDMDEIIAIASYWKNLINDYITKEKN